MMHPMLRRSLLLALAATGFAILNYFAPLQFFSVVFDICLVAFIAGLVSLARPLRFLDIGSRNVAFIVVLMSILVGTCALLWPARPKVVAANGTLINEYMPRYEVNEFHSVVAHAPPEQVYRAMKETTFSEVKVFSALMQIRRAAGGKFARVKGADTPIFALLSRPGSGFVLLGEDPQHEIAFGTGGRFWSTGAARSILSRDDFIAYNVFGSAKSVFNIRLEDLGNGWTRVSTETRVLGNDPSASRKMAAYWRVIYPGSATIRRMWMRAIKTRAERG